MKIALAQMEVKANMPECNLETMLHMIEEAKAQHVDLITFPEMCVGGYLVGDKHLEESFCKDLEGFNEILRQASEGIAIAYGNIYVDDTINERLGDHAIHPNKDGRSRKFNAIYVFQNGTPVKRKKETPVLPTGVQPKILLPNYRIFNDERYYFSLKDVARDADIPLDDLMQPFVIKVDGKDVPVGFELCEDLWCEDYREGGHALNPTKKLIANGAKLIVNISASPWTFGKNKARDRRVQFLKEDCNNGFVPFLYVNKVGAQNNGKDIVTFDGGSTAYNSDGKPILFAKAPYQEELMIIDRYDLPVQERTEKPKIAQKYEAIIRGIQHVKDMAGVRHQPNYIIGLSGGVDSAVVAALLVKAVGNDRVFGINMPTVFNSDKTKNAACQVAKALDIGYAEIPIQELVDTEVALLNRHDLDGGGKRLSTLNVENVQAKIRGTGILSNIAAKYNALFTNNGNKLETALGYATLYGDIGGALAPIGDLTKTEVVELARYLNDVVFQKEVIPNAVLPDNLWRFTADQIQPSAELKEKQVDPMKFGYHCALLEAVTDYRKKSAEDIMEWYIDGTLHTHLGISVDLMKRWNVDKPEEFVRDLDWFMRLHQQSVFKRVQSPPIIITSKSAYGYDIRESILPYRKTAREQELTQRVLALQQYIPVGK